MNKNICLLLTLAFMLLQVSASTEVEGSGHPLSSFASFLGNYINNGFWFGMLTVYNIYCFAVGYTYVFWFNDGGYHFYKCFYSVPARVTFL